ncbi:MAG: glucose 1-dehydrogenase [Gracilibacteraceae bacterium]|jgi:NAD(P)-dependent dehydrogenase (short-subunit alcohol dehydrogenase family)|nr:glucose 1-dehydrogenase [Gracilibacteraceae bacterium]
MGRLDGKVAIVTGSAGGQGEAEARVFAREGASVVLTDVQEEKVAAVAADIVKAGGKAVSFKHDVSSDEEWQGIVAKTLELYGKIDVLMNNAGTGGWGGRIAKFNPEEWDFVLKINLMGSVYGMKNVLPLMQEAGRGSVINVASLSSLSAMGGSSPYTASKAAIRYLTKGAALEYAPYNVRVNAVVPGIIRSAMTIPILDNPESPVYQEWRKKIKTPRFGMPEDIAYAVLYLASDESEHVTGIELPVDGGYMLV